MATRSLSLPRPRAALLPRLLTGPLSGLLSGLLQRLTLHRARHRLAELDDHLLQDIGLSRGQATACPRFFTTSAGESHERA